MHLFHETKEIIRSRKSKKDRQYNGKKKKPNKQTTTYRTLHRKLKDLATQNALKTRDETPVLQKS
jgi:hypothetical protein